MSSATSTDRIRPKPDIPYDGLQPWQFFMLAALACATAVTFLAGGQGVPAVVVLTVLMGATALVGLAALRTLRPLVTRQEARTSMIGDRTRAALEREKMLALRTIKELEFDRAMGKLSEEDFHDMSVRLRARAARIIRQLDASAGYRSRIEADLEKRLGAKTTTAAKAEGTARAGTRVCTACSTANDHDARFCKECGGRL